MTKSFIRELKRRNVFRVAVMYFIVSWMLMQIGDLMFPALLLPEWSTTMLVAFLLLGFPVALILSWAYEATPEGIKRSGGVAADESIAAVTGRKINYSIIAVLVVGVIFLLAKDLLRQDPGSSTVPTGTDRSIAVLPFANRSAAEENAEFFAAGVQDELLTLLSKLGGIKVISRTSVENLKEGLSIVEIGELLGVATILEGQVQRAGDSLRINVQLIDAAHEDHLWATTYDRQLTAGNVFEVQSEIARTIANSLHAELSDSDEAILNKVPTENTEALRLYMQGRQLLGRNSFDALRKAENYFKEAVSLDREYAEAWTALAGVYLAMHSTGLMDERAYIAGAEAAVAKALQLDPRLAGAYAQQGMLNWRSGDLIAAETSFRKALDLNSNELISLRFYGTYLRSQGRSAEAMSLLERSLDVDPLSVINLFELGRTERYAGHPEKTLEYARRILEIDPSSVFGYTASALAYNTMGQYALAWPWLVKIIRSDPEDFEAVAHMALIADTLGAPDLADRYLRFARLIGPGEPVTLKCEVQILYYRGQVDAALAIARQALDDDLDNRWSSTSVFLRTIRDNALSSGDHTDALAQYRDEYPELFSDTPELATVNVKAAANLALLLRRSGDSVFATALIDASLAWYRDTQVEGVYNEVLDIVYVSLLALDGDKQAALGALRDAVDSGWRWAWQWSLSDKNLDSIRNEPEFQAIVAELEHDMATQLEAMQVLPDMGRFDLRNREFE